MNTYDGTNYVYYESDDTIMTEADMLKKFTAQENINIINWEIIIIVLFYLTYFIFTRKKI